MKRRRSEEWVNVVHVAHATDSMAAEVIRQAGEMGCEVREDGEGRVFLRKVDARRVAQPLLMAMWKRQELYRRAREHALRQFMDDREAVTIRPVRVVRPVVTPRVIQVFGGRN